MAVVIYMFVPQEMANIELEMLGPLEFGAPTYPKNKEGRTMISDLEVHLFLEQLQMLTSESE